MIGRAIRLWPLIGVLAMVLLGAAVRRGATPVDDTFQEYRYSRVRLLLYLTDPTVLSILLAVVVVVALFRRRWLLAAFAVLSPVVAVACVEVAKRLFGRTKGGGLSYPSGHTAVMVVVMGFLLLVAGGAMWAILIAVVYCALGAIGLAVTVHYFTDTIGGMLLGTAIVCAAAVVAGHIPRRT